MCAVRRSSPRRGPRRLDATAAAHAGSVTVRIFDECSAMSSPREVPEEHRPSPAFRLDSVCVTSAARPWQRALLTGRSPPCRARTRGWAVPFQLHQWRRMKSRTPGLAVYTLARCPMVRCCRSDGFSRARYRSALVRVRRRRLARYPAALIVPATHPRFDREMHSTRPRSSISVCGVCL